MVAPIDARASTPCTFSLRHSHFGIDASRYWRLPDRKFNHPTAKPVRPSTTTRNREPSPRCQSRSGRLDAPAEQPETLHGTECAPPERNDLRYGEAAGPGEPVEDRN